MGFVASDGQPSNSNQGASDVTGAVATTESLPSPPPPLGLQTEVGVEVLAQSLLPSIKDPGGGAMAQGPDVHLSVRVPEF